jgi:acyl carrier protein
MYDSDVHEAFVAVAAKVLDVDVTALRDGASFKHDLDADSLDLVELVMALEDQFDIEVLDTEINGIETVGDAIDLVLARLATGVS